MATIREIAQKVGVSSATVSRVLNADPTISVSDDKRRAILETAAALKYRTPRSRNGARLGTIALVNYLDAAEELRDPYYVGLRLGMEARCHALGIDNLRVQGRNPDAHRSQMQVAAGAIVIGAQSNEEWSWMDRFKKNIVFADCDPPTQGYDWVGVDLAAATSAVLDRLNSLGYRRIGYIGFSQAEGDPDQEEVRFGAYLKWMRQKGLYHRELCAVDIDQPRREWEQLGYRMAAQLIKPSARTDAIVAFNDNVAIGAYRILHEAGIDIPGQIAVVSFNDISVARFLTPSLSTVHLPAEAIGEAAVDLLVERIRGRGVAKSVALASDIIWRDSVVNAWVK